MAQRIKNRSELPEWFILEKYRMAETLDAAGWYIQLNIRARCLSFLSQPKPEDLSGILGHFRAAPIVDVTTYNFFNFHYHYGMFYEEPIIEQSKHGIHSLTVYEFFMAEINMEKSKRIHAKAYFDVKLFGLPKRPRNPSIFSTKKTEFLYKPIHDVLCKPLDQALLGINLLLPDRELFKQFKDYLPVLRKECCAPIFSEKWNKPDFAEWARLGVLPYLDLLIWQKETGTNISYMVMEEAIFPSYEGSEDRIRKTTKPKAKELISKKSLAFLSALAIRKQGE